MKRFIVSVTLVLATAIQGVAFAGDGSITQNFNVQLSPSGLATTEISIARRENEISTTMVLPPCSSLVQNDCIESVEWNNDGKAWKKGTFVEFIPLKNVNWDDLEFKSKYEEFNQNYFLKSDNEHNFPYGGRTNIWSLPGASHALGSSYSVSVSFSGQQSLKPENKGLVVWGENFSAQLSPIWYDKNSDKFSCNGMFVSARYSCVSMSKPHFPLKTKFRITIRLKMTKNVLSSTPWMTGRIANSRLISNPYPDGTQLFSIEGSPITTGFVQIEIPKSDANYEVLKAANEAYSLAAWGNKNEISISNEDFKRASGSGYKSNSLGAVDAWRILDSKFPFKFLSEEEVWMVGASVISKNDMLFVDKCQRFDVGASLVSSNAVGINPGPPTWNQSSSELSYSIAAPHLRMNGTPYIGFYELSMSKKLAECLWGKDVSNYRAVISLTSSDGENKVATTTFSTFDKNLFFRAAGFGYSVNSISVGLNSTVQGVEISDSLPDFFVDLPSQPSPNQTSNPAPVATPPVAQPKKLELGQNKIVCIKGNLKKTVVAVKPKCPKGFKVKG